MKYGYGVFNPRWEKEKGTKSVPILPPEEDEVQ